MKTDTSIVNESLQDAAWNYSIEFAPGDYEQRIRIRTFKDAAQWQKEQLLPLLQSHAELLRLLKVFTTTPNTTLKEWFDDFSAAITAIEKANQLTK